MSVAPPFRSPIRAGGPQGGALPRRRLGRGLLFSVTLHMALLGSLLVLVLLDIGPIPPPPLTIRFFAAAPPAPRLVPLRDRREPSPRREAERPETSPVPPPVAPPVVPFDPVRPQPAPLRVEPDPLPIRVADEAPELAIHDPAPPAPFPVSAQLDRLPASTTPQAGGGEEPDLVFLVPGEARERGPGGGLAGRDPATRPPAADPTRSIRRQGGGTGRAADADGLTKESACTVTGLASFLGRRYGVTLTEASRLGSRTSDGARYALLLPALSEAYRALSFRGRRRGGSGDMVESLQADADAIAIHFRDGTVHVLAPTRDGLVALFVSSRTGTPGRSKVQEAERALSALQRFAGPGASGRAG